MKPQALCAVLIFLGLAAGASAQQAKAPAPAPTPPQILAAHKVFVCNGGGESFETVIGQTVFSGGPDRPYNQFYETMKDWGRYELVASPSDADLVLEGDATSSYRPQSFMVS